MYTDRVIAVVTSPHRFKTWAEGRPHLLSLSRDRAIWEDCIAHRCDDFRAPWQGSLHEVVVLPTHGETFASLADAAPTVAERVAA